jgi:ferric-dicitrate binding protein FerR (iron transport regulator)
MSSHSHNAPLEPNEVAELKRLIAAKSDDALSPEDSRRLQQLLTAKREARVLYISHMQLDAGLDWRIRGHDALQKLTEAYRLTACGDQQSDSPSTALADGSGTYLNTSWKRRRGRRRLIYVAAALAASLACVLASAVWFQPGGWGRGLWTWNNTLPETPEAEVPRAGSGEAAARIVALSNDCGWFLENRRDSEGVVLPGDKVRLTRGQLRLDFTCGAKVTMRSPAALDVLTPMRTRAVLGTLIAHVEKGAEGFTVDTPRTTVVDLGTDFGIDVTDHGRTDVVVFKGAVDLHSDGIEGLHSRQRLGAGEAVRVSSEGTASRIVSITDSQFAIADAEAAARRTPVIAEVRDNIRRGESWYYYEIVHGGLHEDAKAFVDREHEWNGVAKQGIPSFLLGGDYVKTFNDDKLNRQVEIRVTLSRPAALYVLLDKRSPPPDWLREQFFNTGDEIGLDGGGYSRYGERKTLTVGPGESIDDVFSIWQRDVPAGTIKLGAIHVGGEKHNMYGIIAVPLELNSQKDDHPGVAAQPSRKWTPLAASRGGNTTVDGIIERPEDVDVFRFDWTGGPIEAACQTNGFTTLDPCLCVFNSNELCVGYARANRVARERASVTMNLPAGLYYAAVSGGVEVGDVGAYLLTLAATSGNTPPFTPPSPSLALRAVSKTRGTAISWDASPQATNYTVEKSHDGVKFRALATTEKTAILDEEVERGALYTYRLRVDHGGDSTVSAPVLLQAGAGPVTGLQTFGISPRSIVLEWNQMAGGRGFRIERSADGADFQPIGAAPAHACGYRDTRVEAGRQYKYRVGTLEINSEISYSTPISALSGVADLTATPLPSKSPNDKPQVLLEWQAPSHESRLFVERQHSGRGTFVTIGDVEDGEPRFVDRSPAIGREARYRLVSVQDVSDLVAAETGAIDSIQLPAALVDENFFALRLTGKLLIKKPGVYTFFLTSDDGSRLFLDGTLVVDNDGHHTQQMASGTLELAAGEHELEVQYFDQGGRKALGLAWSGPGIPFPSSPTSFSSVPASALSSLNYHSYQGRWHRLPFVKVCALSAEARIKLPSPQVDTAAGADVPHAQRVATSDD